MVGPCVETRGLLPLVSRSVKKTRCCYSVGMSHNLKAASTKLYDFPKHDSEFMTMETPSAVPQICQFFVKRKKRFCRMTVKKGNRFCGEHLETLAHDEDGNSDEPHLRRVQCPVDPTHTCYESKLAQHLKVCNAKRLADERPSYIVEGINLGDVDAERPKHVPLCELSQSLVDTVIRKVEEAYERLPPVAEDILCENMLKSEIDNPIYGDGLRKHLLQNASLLAHIKRAGLTRENTCFIEFGAGKGKLTYWLARMIGDQAESSVLLVDRSSHRHKSDNKLKNEECPINVTRIRADIADLRLRDVREIGKNEHVVGIAKHLCGVATDLTIRCLVRLMQDDASSRVAGLVIAFCCHHRCEYSSYVGKEYLQSCGFAAEEFPILCSIASWATCGTGKNRDASVEDNEEKDRTIAKRECIGRKVKSLLNWGRIDYLRSVGFDSRLCYYTTPKVSLENMCMIAVRNKS